MIEVYRIFQLIFGVIVSFFILYFLIQYTSNYAGFQGNVLKTDILKSFRDEVSDVYTTGVYTNFTLFSRYDFSSCAINTTVHGVPEIVCDFAVSGIPITTPLLLCPGKRVFLWRDSVDLGWYKLFYVQAVPDITLIFVPMDDSDEVWNLMRTLVSHLPDTSDPRITVNIKYDFCDGEPLKVCGGSSCEKEDFLKVIENVRAPSLRKCEHVPQKGRVITFSKSCESFEGICIEPPLMSGVGNAYISGTRRVFVYKDPIDLIALIIGYTKKDVFGITRAERVFDYKNKFFSEMISKAARISSERMKLIENFVPGQDECEANPGLKNCYCKDVYRELSDVLHTVSQIADSDYNSFQDMVKLSETLSHANELYQVLIERGCEYEV